MAPFIERLGLACLSAVDAGKRIRQNVTATYGPHLRSSHETDSRAKELAVQFSIKAKTHPRLPAKAGSNLHTKTQPRRAAGFGEGLHEGGEQETGEGGNKEERGEGVPPQRKQRHAMGEETAGRAHGSDSGGSRVRDASGPMAAGSGGVQERRGSENISAEAGGGAGRVEEGSTRGEGSERGKPRSPKPPPSPRDSRQLRFIDRTSSRQ